MAEFSLSRTREKTLPDSIRTEDGRTLAIDADFRTVLKCLRVLDDPDVKDRDKLYLLMRWFFKGAFVPDCAALFEAFLAGDDAPEEHKPVMDFEQDADAIYSGFMMDYGIDLLDVPFLHWAKFRALLSGLSEQTALSRRIALREMDTKRLKGKAKADAERAKRRVKLRKAKVSAEEKALQDEIDRALSEGRNPAEAVEALRRLQGGGEDGE